MWLHRQVILGIILSGLVIVIAAQPYGRRVSGEDTDAQAILNLGCRIEIVKFRIHKLH
jgi:hypothetical protein